VQASITGHLVFSTLHTNDTASAVVRFLDFGVQPFQLSSAVLGIAAVRLVRKLCLSCREKHTPSQFELDQLKIKAEDVPKYNLYRAGTGCETCLGQGYQDRVGVYELLVFDDEIRSMILKTQDAKTIKRLAIKKGMKTIRDSAFQKVLQGITSFDEAVQTTQSEDLDMEPV